MITGDQLREARSKARLTQDDLAAAVGVTLRSVGNWERGSGVPKNKEGAVRAVLSEALDPTSAGNPLAAATDIALLAELGRRLARKETSWGLGEPGPEDGGDDEGVPTERHLRALASDDTPPVDEFPHGDE